MESHSDSDHDEKENNSKRGPTVMKKTNHKGKLVVTYNSKGVPIGKEGTKLSSFEGVVARSMIPITYDKWTDVSEDKKEELWQYILANYEVSPNSRKQTLQSIGTKWRNFKHTLYKEYIEKQKDDREAKKNLLDPPVKKYPALKTEDWKLFVAQRLSNTWQDKSKKGKNVRAHHQYNHHLSRKGYAKLLIEMMQETGKTEEEIDRAMLWKKARVLKSGGYDENVKEIVDKIDNLQKSEDSGVVTCGTNDVLTQALGTTEQRGRVRGMGRFVTPHKYFYLPKTVKQILDTEKKKYDQRFTKLEDELEKLKKGMINTSEAGSCQMWGNEDFEDDPLEEQLDNSCFLAVEFASNIVAKGTILEDTCEEELIEVMLEISIQGEALLPIPLEEEFIETVKDAIGHILSWPRYLVIRCSDLEKVAAKPKRKPDVVNKKGIESKKEKERPRKAIVETKKENEKKPVEKGESKKEVKGKRVAGEEMTKENVVKKRMTRGQRKERVRMEINGVLMIAAAVVDGHLNEKASIKLLCEADLFGYESFTYIDWEDFEAVFTLDEATGSVITTYMMSLYKQMLDKPECGSGICFVHPCAISPSDRKTTPKHIEDASRQVADRLFKRNGRDIIMLAYNPGRHWVLGVLDMKKDTCFYLDSLRHSNINEQLRQIIDMAMAMYAARSGTSKRVKLKWVNAKCPKQPGSTECGYYVMKFMKEIVCKGVEILYNDNVAGRVEEYTDADLDDIREDWSNYVTTFI